METVSVKVGASKEEEEEEENCTAPTVTIYWLLMKSLIDGPRSLTSCRHFNELDGSSQYRQENNCKKWINE